MSARTTLIDRRIATAVLAGIPELPEEVIKYHLEHMDDLHRGVEALLRRGRPPMREFAPGVLGRVRDLGGQFAQARMIQVPGGETLQTQKNRVIKFWSTWHFGKLGKDEELTVSPSLGTEVIYLPGLVEGSLRCTFDLAEGHDCVQDILDRLPKVPGLRWIVGNSSTITRVLANHKKETNGEYLLPNVYTWTTDAYKSPEYGLRRLFVGFFLDDGVFVYCDPPDFGDGLIGLFALGVPAEE